MNASIKDPLHPSFVYYDSDYPSKTFPVYPENFDEKVSMQGIADDVDQYRKIISEYGSNVLELCCGTGRVSIPLLLAGCKVTAVDIAAPLLKRFKSKITDICEFNDRDLQLVKNDVTRLSLEQTNYDVVICAFNSLLCIPDFELQQQTLFRASAHLKPNGILALDIWNPLMQNLHGDELPEAYLTRRRVDNGNSYTRFAATGPMRIDQVQHAYGWYDETDEHGLVTRTPYNMDWRLIFRYEIQLMLEKAGFVIKDIFGDNNRTPLRAESLKMFILAEKKR